MSSNPAETMDIPKPKSIPVPFFGDFDKKTGAFWKVNNYALGRQIDVCVSPTRDTYVKAKVTDGHTVSSEISAEFDTDWGCIEVIENARRGVSAKVHFHNIFREWNLATEHSESDLELTADYRPAGSFWCTKLIGLYRPDLDGARVCRSRASVVVQDSQYRLAVGGEIELEDRRNSDGTKHHDHRWLKGYSMGFLYSPTETSQYSITYSPNRESNGVNYDLSLFKKVSDSVTVAGRAEGKADFRNIPPPRISLGASWSNNDNLVRGFVNSNREYGLSYEVKLTAQTHITLGLSSFLARDSDETQTNVGFKLCFC